MNKRSNEQKVTNNPSFLACRRKERTMKKMIVDDMAVAFTKRNQDDYISLTDMAKCKNAEATGLVISHWLSTRYAIEFLGIWETINNPDFNVTEFSNIRIDSGSNGYVLSSKQWIERTDAIKQNLISAVLTKQQMSIVYANEADVLNMALFGFTAKDWRDTHPDLQGNVRDYASVNQLICLSNMESLNSVLINDGVPQSERLQKLNQIAISQMTVLESVGEHKLLK